MPARPTTADALWQALDEEVLEALARRTLTAGVTADAVVADILLWALIRAKKLRYYEDRNFTARVFSAPVLADDGHADKPTPRPDDWGNQVRGPHLRLAAVDGEDALSDDEGGVQQQRHPGLSEEGVSKPIAPEQEDLFGLVEDDSDVAADKRVMDRISQAYGVNEGSDPHDDLLPGF